MGNTWTDLTSSSVRRLAASPAAVGSCTA
jgi:hypothetical protein